MKSALRSSMLSRAATRASSHSSMAKSPRPSRMRARRLTSDERDHFAPPRVHPARPLDHLGERAVVSLGHRVTGG
jgi:hypothetical protein